ncbi:hypothetical protein [Rhodoblastus sp.]|uniref:hypothetical protein n=1 Tax=Rhodoblastus sp. TaxID=1962975 RepID=UPI0035AEE4A9
MKRRTIIAAVLIAAPSLAFGHATKIGEHGGRQTDAGAFHVEVVAKDKNLDVYMHDHSAKAVNAAGFKGVAIFKDVSGKPERIPLEPAGDNKLSGVAPASLPTELEGAVQITTQTGSSIQGKFMPQAMEHDHMDGHDQ